MLEFIKHAEKNSTKLKAIRAMLNEATSSDKCELNDPIDFRQELINILELDGYAEHNWLAGTLKPKPELNPF